MCAKIRYNTVDEAECALAKVILSNWAGKMCGGVGGYYQCPDCGGYHITRQKHNGRASAKIKELHSTVQ